MENQWSQLDFLFWGILSEQSSRLDATEMLSIVHGTHGHVIVRKNALDVDEWNLLSSFRLIVEISQMLLQT